MKIYQFTDTGKRICGNTNAPDSSNWRVIYALRALGGRATDDQIVLQSGLPDNEVFGALTILKHRGIVISS